MASVETPLTLKAHLSGPAGKVMVLSPDLMTLGSCGSISRLIRVWTPAASSLPLMWATTDCIVRVSAPISARSIAIVFVPPVVFTLMLNFTSP
ncbi:hypothetical protein D3C87_1416630 [compost metagenome]